MKLSIITINYNDSTGLSKTLDSVAFQSYFAQKSSVLDVEHIIVDGGSTDDSVKRIKDYELKIKKEDLGIQLHWSSEKDKGIYNAMNKGARLATGDYLLYLNGGDCFSDNQVLECLSQHTLDADIIIGRVNQVREGKILVRDYTVRGELTLFNHFLWGVPHQGVLMRRTIQLSYPYDEGYRISSDFGFFLHSIIVDNRSVQYLPLTISNYDLSGISSTNTQLLMKERLEIYNAYIPKRIRMDYDKIFPHYYEMMRLDWLLHHPFFYRVYRAWTTLGMKIMK